MKLKKKLEIIEIDDILTANNSYLSENLNHYMKSMLFNLRIIFRHNMDDDLENLIKFYYELEDILTKNIKLENEDIKKLITQITKITLNTTNVYGMSIIYENTAKLIDALYNELKTHTHPVTFNELINILNNTTDENTKMSIINLLKSNFTLEYQQYLARINL
ncbi:hypothetical protein [Methanosphaera cuniculi]|uniref:hypothetical protein n=1 Tax=Methanosphaera cuniculi TaxID=1077256 RepID=UPI0026EA7959|nr:hypothetical protein [Methanosphaera cuniculi]